MIPQAEVADFLAGLAGSAPIETHISAVFVGPDCVYKLKKAVRLEFLDFVALDQRERFVRRELSLNQPAAPGLYRDVVPVVRRFDGSLALDAEGEPVDWVLRMARVSKSDFLDRIAAEGRLDPKLLDALADAVAEYHAALPPVGATDPVSALRKALDGNAAAAISAGLDRAGIEVWQSRAVSALDTAAPRLAARADRIRRAHGDLHLGNLCLWQGRPVPFDALEFDEDLATIDLGYDLAFLLMDLDHRVDRACANRVLNRYVDRTGDAGLLAPLPLFLSLRAVIRAHVEAASGHHAAADAYLKAAHSYLKPTPSRVIAIGGLPGTGKSTLSRVLAPALGAAPGALVLRSDTIRKRQYKLAPEQRLPESAYTREAAAAVMTELVDLARTASSGGHTVIADATFTDPTDRRRIALAAPTFVGIWLQAPIAVLEHRIAARQHDASDATPALMHRMAARDPGAGDWLAIDATDLEAARLLVTEHLASQIPP